MRTSPSAQVPPPRPVVPDAPGDDDAYTTALIDFVTASPTSYHAVAETASRLDAVGLSQADESRPWGAGTPRRGYVVRDGAIVAWILPERCDERAGFRIVGAHTDSPALKLKPSAAMVRDGVQVLDVEVYGGPLLNSFLDRELGLAGRLVTRDGAVRLVRTGPVARVAQVAAASTTPSISTGRRTSCPCGPWRPMAPAPTTRSATCASWRASTPVSSPSTTF